MTQTRQGLSPWGRPIARGVAVTEWARGGPRPLRQVVESVVTAPLDVDARSGRLLFQALTPGWGSSGHYSAQVCEAAAPLVTVGMHMYFDHERGDGSGLDQYGNRSIGDIAAVVTEAGRWDSQRQAVVAECKVTAPYRPVLLDEDLATSIGLSIRGSATDVSHATVEGRNGPVIEGLAQIDSVDFVSRAGRGGRILKVLESARPTTDRALLSPWGRPR